MKISEPLQADDLPQTEFPLMSSLGVSLAKTYRSQAKARALAAVNHPSGKNTPVLLAKFDHNTLLWKTSQRCLGGGWETFSGTWPRAGMMQRGTAFQLRSSARRITGTGYGLLPTPSGTSNHGKNHVSGRLDEWGGSSNPFRGTDIGKIHSPRFEEWMMGYPDRWTELTD
jgi:hypothetical protein